MTRQRSLSAYNAHTENAYQAVTNFCLSDLTTYRAGPTSLHEINEPIDYECRLLARIKRTCYVIENKIMKMQMSKQKTQYNTQKSTCN